MGFELVMNHAYSPVLAPMDFEVFPVVKSALKGLRFAIFDELSISVCNVVSEQKQVLYVDMFEHRAVSFR